jgi:hypothetical protein
MADVDDTQPAGVALIAPRCWLESGRNSGFRAHLTVVAVVIAATARVRSSPRSEAVIEVVNIPCRNGGGMD